MKNKKTTPTEEIIDRREFGQRIQKFCKQNEENAVIVIAADTDGQSLYVGGKDINIAVCLAVAMHQHEGLSKLFKDALDAFENTPYDA